MGSKCVFDSYRILVSRFRGNDGQVKRVSGIRHIQVETVLVLQRRFLNLVSFWPETASRKAS